MLGRWVAVRGVLAAVCKALIEWYFVNFLPLPYWVLKRLPFKQPRRDGGTRGLPKERQLARSGGSGVLRNPRRRRQQGRRAPVTAAEQAAADMAAAAAAAAAKRVRRVKRKRHPRRSP